MASDDGEVGNDLSGAKADELISASKDVIDSNKKLASSNDDLALAIANRQEWNKTAKTRWLSTLAVLVVLMVGGGVTLAILLSKINASLDSGREVRSTLVDCIKISKDPATCYAQNRRDTEATIVRLLQGIEYQAVCAPEVAALPRALRVSALDACVKAVAATAPK